MFAFGRILSGIGILACISACASSPKKAPPPEPIPVTAMRPAIDGVPKSALGPQELAPGECGLFLWSQTDASKFIFFSRALSDRAVFAQADAPLTLSLVRAGGDIFGQFNTEMAFVAEDGRTLMLAFAPGEVLDGGQRIEDGLISVTDLTGWQTKVPVLGVRACQPE